MPGLAGDGGGPPAEGLRSTLADPALSQRTGDADQRTVGARFLGERHLEQYTELLDAVLG